MELTRARGRSGVVIAWLAAAAVGCGGGSTASRTTNGQAGVAANAPTVSMPDQVRGQLLEGAIAVLGRLDDFDETAAYAQVFDRINQWSHAGPAGPEWTADPLVASLPARFAPLVDEKSLAGSVFESPGDVFHLRDQRWMRDLAMSVRGDAVDDLAVAEAIFRWTTRALASVADPPSSPSESNPGSRWFLPGELLLAGRGSGPQRAWVFLEILRHAGIDGVMLATCDPASGDVRPWIPAVVTAGEAYLFDTGYGIAIPSPDGTGIATARIAATDPSVLAGMDVPGREYPVKADALKHLAVLVSASPEVLSRRMKQVESNLSGSHSMRLCVDASGLAARAVASLPQGSAAAEQSRLWEFPFETLLARRSSRRPAIDRAAAMELATMQITVFDPGDGERAVRREIRPLFTGKLREFRGDLDGPNGAKAAYLLARPSSARIRELVAKVPPQQAEVVRRLYEQLKQDAAYALGLVMLREGQFEAAADYLGRMTLEAHPDSRWADAARVALADAVAALGRIDEARKLLEADESPQRFGSRLRAERLADQAAERR
jgi:hypothetical protein